MKILALFDKGKVIDIEFIIRCSETNIFYIQSNHVKEIDKFSQCKNQIHNHKLNKGIRTPRQELLNSLIIQ